ncbi:hypothetical protein BD414DRAFT_421607 [Trametes punicea]|nr:hypothetical protein BD414DRAFT_421607 [Trametes punicea]
MLCTPLSLYATLLVVYYAALGCYGQVNIDPSKSPLILRPNGADVWTVGSVETVRWSNEGLDITNDQGSVVLGYLDPSTGQTNEYIRQPLVEGFQLADEVVNVVTPDVPSGDFYYIVLLGNADNESPLFSIINPKSPAESIVNVTFPNQLSISSAPAATVSHSSSSAVASPATSSSSASPSASSPTSSSSGASGACRRTEGSTLGWLFAIMLSIVACLVA